MILEKKFIKFNDLSLNVKDLLEESEILNIEKIKSKQWTMYDIEVEDNHNFFANGILAHNSLETDEVYNLRQDAVSEVGAVLRCSGMTNFTSNSPAGRAFYNEDREHVINYPQYVNPFWNEAEKQKRLEQFGGQDSVGYKVYVKGEVVEDSSTTFDMNRIEKQCYIGGKNPPDIERFEISKDNFKNFKNLIVLERPENVDRLFLSSDIGEKVTEIVIHSEKNNKYYYRYNIVLYNLTHIEQLEVFRHIIDKLETEVIAIDCGDGEGRVIYRELEKLYSKENMVWYDGSRKIDIDIETDEKGNLIYEKGKPKYKQEYMAQWSVTRLQHLLYNGKFRIPKDFKFHSQFSVVVSMVSGTRTKYKCISQTGDHLFDAWKVFAIAQWRKHDFNQTQRPTRKKSIGVVSW